MPFTQFRHEAMLYAGQAGFVDRTATFLRDAVAAEEPTLVVVSEAKIDLLRTELGADADQVQFADMAEVGRNPARIIPAWREFVAKHADGGRHLRGVGEPIWAGRTPDELVECERHEALVNLAFDGAPAWWLVCPYDTETLPPSVIEEAHRNHPFLLNGSGSRRSANFQGLDSVAKPFDAPLPQPPGAPRELAFGPGRLDGLRRFVFRHAAASGLSRSRTEDMVFAANEAATNSMRHGGGSGLLRVWSNDGTFVCEVADEGHIDQPLAGRERPSFENERGFGLWLVNHMCDLVQIRSFETGSVVRLHMRIR
jgi:anti-sigma regulatory factor (Ser/Thr protein kinase)